MYGDWGRGGKLVEHIDETDRRIDRISEELSARTKILATDLLCHVELTDNDSEVVRNHVTEVNVQVCEGNSKLFFSLERASKAQRRVEV